MSDETEFATGGVWAFDWSREWQGGCIVPALGPYVLETLGRPAAWELDPDAPPLTITLDNTLATYGRAQGTTTDDNAGG